MQMQCENCGWLGDDKECEPARDLGERHELGCIFSGEECPECGSLAYPVDRKEVYPWLADDDARGWAEYLIVHIGADHALAVAAQIKQIRGEQ